jgi:hypothetical protein
MGEAQDNYDASIFYLNGINETYERDNTRKIFHLTYALEELLQAYGHKRYFVAFIKDIHDNESLKKFPDVNALITAFRAVRDADRAARAAAAAAPAAAAPAAAAPAAAAAPVGRYRSRSRSRSRGGKKKSHKKRSHRRRH